MSVILGVRLQNRGQNAVKFQKILTEYGCYIGTRLGLHSKDEVCSESGIILLEIFDNDKAVIVSNKLLEIESIELQRMTF